MTARVRDNESRVHHKSPCVVLATYTPALHQVSASIHRRPVSLLVLSATGVARRGSRDCTLVMVAAVRLLQRGWWHAPLRTCRLQQVTIASSVRTPSLPVKNVRSLGTSVSRGSGSDAPTMPPSPASTSSEESLKPRLQLTFTCTVPDCGTRSTHEFSKHSYTNGIVLVQCPGCKNRYVERVRM